MKKIVFGITSLGLGGAERVLVDLANELSKSDEYDITIFTIYGQGELEKQVSEKVTITNIYNEPYNKLNKIKQKFLIPVSMLIRKNRIYKKYIQNKYDIEIAFLEGPVTRVFSCGKHKQRKIAWIHNDIAQVFGTGLKAKLKIKIDEKLYKKFDKLVFVSNDNLKKFEKVYKNTVSKEVIYNYINSENVIEKSKQAADIKFDENQANFVTVARLVEQKALDRLINVHTRLIKEGYNHNFYIIGDGPEKDKLKKMINDNKIQTTFKLLGKSENPYPYMKQADYFCLLSHFEGYPMVIEEAKILNKSILITDTAAREVIRDYKYSKIFKNSEDGIYEGLKEIITKTKEEIVENLEYSNFNIIDQIKKII